MLHRCPPIALVVSILATPFAGSAHGETHANAPTPNPPPRAAANITPHPLPPNAPEWLPGDPEAWTLEWHDEFTGPAGDETNPNVTRWFPMLGYGIARDKYKGREDVGLVVQLAVPRKYRRSLVAANLLQRVFEAWPRGVRLCGCWCAQDLPANRFWEACGFRAFAFRTGAREARWTTYDDDGKPTGKAKGHRIHIYWQKRIRGERDAVNYWYPGETGGGSINESRLVFPIPPGSSWRDAKPAILPGVGAMFEALRAQRDEVERRALLQLAPPEEKRPQVTKSERKAIAEAAALAEAEKSAERKRREAASDAARATAGRGGLRFAPLPPDRAAIAAEEADRVAAEAAAVAAAKEANVDAKKQAKAEAKRIAKAAVKKFNAKNDPQLKAMARELRDRWMEAVEQNPEVLSLPSDAGAGYDVSRQLGAPSPGPSQGEGRKTGNVKRVGCVKRSAA